MAPSSGIKPFSLEYRESNLTCPSEFILFPNGKSRKIWNRFHSWVGTISRTSPPTHALQRSANAVPQGVRAGLLLSTCGLVAGACLWNAGYQRSTAGQGLRNPGRLTHHQFRVQIDMSRSGRTIGCVRDQACPHQPSDLRSRNVNRGQRRATEFGHGDVVEPGHRNVAWYRDPLIPQFADDANGDPVIDTENRGGRELGSQQLAGGLAASGESVLGRCNHQTLGAVASRSLQELQPPGFGGPYEQRRADKCHTAVPQSKQQFQQHPHALTMVKSNRGKTAGGLAGIEEHYGNLRFAQLFQDGRLHFGKHR